MLPILFSIGPLHVFSLGIFLFLAWVVFSFLFWKTLRGHAISDEHIFDLTFYSSIVMFMGARVSYVLLNSSTFLSDPLRIVAIWVSPGLSFYGGLISGLIALYLVTKKVKQRLGMVLDALAASLPIAITIGLLGGLLDGAAFGLPTSLPWAVSYVGQTGMRHPIELYEIASLILIMVLLKLLGKRAQKDHWPYGHMGLVFFALFSLSMFLLEFFKESGIYFFHLHPNQWVQIALFSQSLGALYVRGGGKYTIRNGLGHVTAYGRHIIGGIYGKVINRDTQ